MTDLYIIKGKKEWHTFSVWYNQPDWKECEPLQIFKTYDQALNWVYSQFILID